MRLLTFTSLFPSSARPHHGLFVAARLRELRRRQGIEAEVLAPVPWFPFRHPRFGDYARWAATPREETWDGVSVSHPRYPMVPGLGMRSQPWAIMTVARRWLRRRLQQGQRFDAIDAHYFYPDGVAAAALSREFGLPLVITARGSDLNLIGQDVPARQRMLAAAAQASACVGVSAALVDVLRGWGVPSGKLHVMRNGVDLNHFSPQPRDTARAALGLDADAPLMLGVGHLVELKGFALAVQALPTLRRRWPGLQLALIGDGPQREALRALAHECGVQDAVRFVGAVDNAQLLPWYCAADLLVLASSREGLPNVLLESLACGTPVLATSVGGIPEVMTQPFLGELLPERSAAAIAAAAQRWLASPPDRECIRDHALGFSWDRTTSDLASLFASVTGPTSHA